MKKTELKPGAEQRLGTGRAGRWSIAGRGCWDAPDLDQNVPESRSVFDVKALQRPQEDSQSLSLMFSCICGGFSFIFSARQKSCFPSSVLIVPRKTIDEGKNKNMEYFDLKRLVRPSHPLSHSLVRKGHVHV